jgi:hypothetical protein
VEHSSRQRRVGGDSNGDDADTGVDADSDSNDSNSNSDDRVWTIGDTDVGDNDFLYSLTVINFLTNGTGCSTNCHSSGLEISGRMIS